MPADSIYLDHNATTPIDPRVVEAMARAWRDCGANPASQHAPGRRARRLLEEAREGILELLGAKTGGMDADQLIFTSGGTEANNLAIFGLASDKGSRIVTSAIEHPSILGPAQELRRRGWNVEFMRPSESGFLDAHLFASMLPVSAGRGLASLMLANNEVGVFLPVAGFAKWCDGSHVVFHTDATQAIGKVRVEFRKLRVAAMTITPHKFHGPLGIGGLVLRHGIKLNPHLLGGFQQAALRPGTENVGLAIGFHTALHLWHIDADDRERRMTLLRDQLEQSLGDDLPDAIFVGQSALRRLPNTSCVSFPGLDRQALVMALDMAGVACSTGSACASGSSEPSPTLVAMGLPEELIRGAIRLSLGAFTTAEEVAEASRRILNAVKHLRSKNSS